MMHYGYRRERDGFEVYSLAEYTLDRRDYIDTVPTEDEAQALIDRLYKEDAHAQRTGITARRAVTAPDPRREDR